MLKHCAINDLCPPEGGLYVCLPSFHTVSLGGRAGPRRRFLQPVSRQGRVRGRLVQITISLAGAELRLRRLSCGKASPFRRTGILTDLPPSVSQEKQDK